MHTVRRLLLLLSALITTGLLYRHLTSSSATHPTTMASTSDRPLRLAILLNDTPQPKTLARVGNYHAVFSALLSAAVAPQPLESQLTITSHDVVNDLDSYPDLDEIDALLLTGSKHTAFDDDPWILKLVEYTKKAIDSGKVKIIGVCYGQQIIARAVGAPIGRSEKGWEVAVTESELTEKGKEIFQLDKMRIHQMHRDVVFEFPKDAIPLASNDICTVQAMYVPGKYIAVQGHPEFTEELISEVLDVRHKQGIFSDEIYDDAMTRAGKEHDGVAIAKGFLRFLRSG